MKLSQVIQFTVISDWRLFKNDFKEIIKADGDGLIDHIPSLVTTVTLRNTRLIHPSTL